MSDDTRHGPASSIPPVSSTSQANPPPGNYGGLTRKNPIFLDYLRFRLPDNRHTWLWLRATLGEMTRRPFGWRAWYDQSAWVLDKGIVAWCSMPTRIETQGVLVDLPGRACAHLRATAQLHAILSYALAHGSITRVDYALDDYEGLLTLDRVAGALEAGHVATRWRKTEKHIGISPPGWTVYLGRTPYRTTMLRIYDKAAHSLPDLPHPEPWVRLELQVNGRTAHALADLVSQEGSQAVRGQIARRVRFTTGQPPGSNDTDRRRHPTAAWWTAYLGSIEPGPALLARPPATTSIDRMKAAVEQQSAPALAAIAKTDDAWIQWFYDMLARGEGRLKAHHLAAISFWKAVESAQDSRPRADVDLGSLEAPSKSSAQHDAPAETIPELRGI